MPNNNQQELAAAARNAQKEFEVILDVLLVPLTGDQGLPKRRRWIGGCLPQLPDLVPVNPDPDAGVIGFCKVEPPFDQEISEDEQRKLVVTVKNQGKGDAPASTTRVVFFDGEVTFSFDLDTPAISAGQSVDLACEIPDFCSVGCEFVIIVDSKNQVIESNKDNNSVPGECPFPSEG